MNRKQALEQLEDLRVSQNAFITSDKELSAIFEKDIEALDYAITCIKTLFKLKDYIKDRNIQYELVGEDMLKIIEEVNDNE